MSDQSVLLILILLLIVNRRDQLKRELTLWFMFLCAFNVWYPSPDNEFYFIINVCCGLFIFTQSLRISRKASNFLAFLPLNIIVISSMLLNTIGLVDYMYFNSILEQQAIITKGISILTVLELLGVAFVSFNGLSIYIEYLSSVVISGCSRVFRVLYPLEIRQSINKRRL